MKRVGCFFGTFDPVHIGHLIIAQHMRQYGDLDEVWIVVSPQNPFKKAQDLTSDAVRFMLVEKAIEGADRIYASEVEFDLPQPSYTANTLGVLREKFPDIQFDLIMGSDNLAGLHKWKDPESIIEHHRVLVYPRPGLGEHIQSAQYQGHPSVNLVKAPLLDISATRIREMVSKQEDIRYLVVESVRQAIKEQGLYIS